MGSTEGGGGFILEGFTTAGDSSTIEQLTIDSPLRCVFVCVCVCVCVCVQDERAT